MKERTIQTNSNSTHAGGVRRPAIGEMFWEVAGRAAARPLPPASPRPNSGISRHDARRPARDARPGAPPRPKGREPSGHRTSRALSDRRREHVMYVGTHITMTGRAARLAAVGHREQRHDTEEQDAVLHYGAWRSAMVVVGRAAVASRGRRHGAGVAPDGHEESAG